MKHFTKTFTIVFLMLAFSATVSAQQKQQKAMQKVLLETNTQALKKLSQKLEAEHQSNYKKALKMAKEKGWVVKEKLPDGRLMQLQGVTKNGRPKYYVQFNDTAAETVSTNQVWPGGAAGLSLDGSGMTAGEWDGGGVLTSHQEFNNTGSPRVIQNDVPEELSDHATHVAGTILGGGVIPEAIGMAYNAELLAHDWLSDESEMANAAAAGMLISNHSYGYVAGWDGYCFWHGDSTNVSDEEDWRFGFYGNGCAELDAMAYNAPYYLICKAAGNDRGDGQYCAGWTSETHPIDGGDDGYDCIGWKGNAKNILTVAAVKDVPGGYSGNPDDVQMTSFSSWGPSDDGRIKPDISANGYKMKSSVSTGDSDYDIYSGTSMATPSTTGSLLLLQEHYSELYGEFMKSATLKALAIHTADEAGPDEGPDYMFGWGLLNTRTAAETISKKDDQAFIDELSLADGNTYTVEITATGTEPLVATIVWTDPEGTPVPTDNLTPALLDPADKMLVNDLDMTLTETSTSTISYPYMLDRDNPANAATTGDNDVDNVEKIYIASPENGTYTINITHEGSITDGPQAFSLIVTGITNGKAVVSTGEIYNITLNSASVDGEIITDNESTVTERGIVYSTSGLPTTDDFKVQAGSGTGTFTAGLTGLSTATNYFVRAYAINGEGTSYGTLKEFRTPCEIITTFPYTQDFAAQATPNCWEITDNAGTGEIWEYATNDDFWTFDFLSTTASNGYAVFNSNGYDSGQPENSDLVTSTFDFTGYEVVNVRFEHAFETFADAKSSKLASATCTFSYSTDGGFSWHIIDSWTGADTENNPEIFFQDVSAELAGEYMVKFKWNWTAEDDWRWAVDDFEVSTQVESCTPPSMQAGNFSVTETGDNHLDISWDNGDGDAAIIIVSKEQAVNALPTNTVSYTANNEFGLGDQIEAGNYVVYNGSANSATITGLLSGSTYHFAIFEYNSTDNCYLTPGLTAQATTSGAPACEYCTSSGKSTANENINLVEFNTISNSSTREDGYSDFTSISTDVAPGASYDLNVLVNTDGSYTDYVRVWFDWNNDCDFDDAGEAYDLGTATGTTSGAPDGCPYTITIPADATIGATTMRISSRWYKYPEPCDESFYGEVEDYSINIIGDTYMATFNITDDESNPVSGASISINSQTLTTTSVGEATINLPDGSYPYTITASGYEEQSGTLSVSGTDVTESVILTTATVTEYTVTFNITDNATSNAINGATININSTTITTDENGTAVINLQDGSYPYTVNATGYDQNSGSVEVNGTDKTENVSLTESSAPVYTLTFNVADNETAAAIENATININSQTISTDANGQATIELEDGDYAYTAEAAGYEQASGSVNINGSDVTESINLTQETAPTYAVNFQVTDNATSSTIENASININGTNLTTDANGNAEILLTNGTYNYSVSASGYTTVSGNIEVIDAGTTENIAMETASSPQYAITFIAKNDATLNTISNVNISTNGLNITTDENGETNVNLEDGNYNYNATHSQYVSTSGGYVVDGEAKTITILMTENEYTLTFEITDGTNAVENAVININNTELTTIADGTATITLLSGNYDYTIEKSGFHSTSASINIDGSDVNHEVALIPYADITFTTTQAGVSCNGSTNGSITISGVSGGSGNGYEYSKNGGTEWQAIALFSNLSAGTYNVQVKDGEGNMSESTTVEIIEPEVISFETNITNVSENGGTDGSIEFINVTGGNGGFEYSIDGGTNWQTETTFYELAAGEYSTKVQDLNGCISTTQSATITEPGILEYTVTFVVALGSEAAQNATILINETTLTTDANGQATTDLTNGEYDYTASFDGHEDQTGTITINGNNVTENIFFQIPTYSATFEITAGGEAAEGATININDQTIETNTQGQASIDLENGEYAYTVNLNGYDELSGTLTVENSNITEYVSFVGIGNNLSSAINIYPNPAKSIIYVECPGEHKISILNSVGKMVQTSIARDKTTLNLSNNPDGLYLIRIETSTATHTQQLILQR